MKMGEVGEGEGPAAVAAPLSPLIMLDLKEGEEEEEVAGAWMGRGKEEETSFS